jgi:hypothetical protein
VKPVEFNAKVSPDRTVRIPSELAHEIPADSTVHVALTPVNQHQSRLDALAQTFGSCKDDSLADIFEQIENDRHADTGRDIDIP